MAKVKIVNADVIEWAKNYKGPKFHALFADVPYEISFMNKSWDSSGIAFNPETWRALAEHLLPGAFLFVFAGTLNDDLISVAMRQAGLRKFHKACLYWNFASGFPKASRIDSAIDRAAGAKRKVVGISSNSRFNKNKMYANGNGLRGHSTYEGDKITAPATPLAKTWAGHRYGLQAIKPAAETILIFQKPYDGKPIDSIVENGSGALNIDGARINIKPHKNDGWRPNSYGKNYSDHKNIYGDGSTIGDTISEKNQQGRWPANLILQHSPDCNGICSPECVVRELDEQSGDLSRNENAINKVYKTRARTELSKAYNSGINENPITDYGDTGGASRYFFQADWNHEAAEKIEQAAAVRYCAKAASTEKEKGLMGNIACLICGDLNTAHHIVIGDKKYHISMAGRDGIPTISEIDQMWRRYRCALKSGGKKTKQPKWSLAECRRNNHPTVKTISLCKYLATLLLPPTEYAPRRIVIPFAGVMSEALGAMLSGQWEEIVAIEKEKEYCDIGKARVKYWQTHKEPVAKKSKSPKINIHKHEKPFTDSFEKWYAKTKKHGGTREEWLRLRERTAELFPELA